MASLNLTGILRDPTGEFSDKNKIRFTHATTTGQTLKGSVSIHNIEADGAYNIDIEYGNVLIESQDAISGRWVHHGTITINSDTPATDLPSLLGITTPATDAELLVFQALVADAATSAASALASKNEAVTSAAAALVSETNAATSAASALDSKNSAVTSAAAAEQAASNSIARSLNVLDSQVIYAANTTTQLGPILYIHDAATQKTWAKPASVGATEVIVSVSAGGVLTTDATTYQLINYTNASELIAIARSLNVADNAVQYGKAGTVIAATCKYLYVSEQQVTYGLPSTVGVGEVISSVIGGVLNTDGGNYDIYTDYQIATSTIYPSGLHLSIPLGVTPLAIRNVPAGIKELRVDTGGQLAGETLYLWEPSGDFSSSAHVLSDVSINGFAEYVVTTNIGIYKFTTKSVRELRGYNSYPTSVSELFIEGFGAESGAQFPSIRGDAIGVDASDAILYAFASRQPSQTVKSNHGVFKITKEITVSGSCTVDFNCIFLCSQGGAFKFKNATPNQTALSLTTNIISGIKLIYTDQDLTRICIDASQTQTNTHIKNCAVASEYWVDGVKHDLFDSENVDGFHSFAAYRSSKNYQIRWSELVSMATMTGFVFETSSDNWGNTQIENAFFLKTCVGWSCDSADGVTGLSDCISLKNVSCNAFYMHNPDVVAWITLDSNVSIGDTQITIGASDYSVYDSAQNVGGDAIVPAINNQIGFPLYTTGRTDGIVSLARPATRDLAAGKKLLLATAGVVSALPVRPLDLNAVHYEQSTFGFVGCGTNGASVAAQSCLYSTNLKQNPAYLLGGEHYSFKNSVYENGDGTHPAFVRVALSDAGGGLGESFKSIEIDAPSTAYFDPSNEGDKSKIVDYDAGVETLAKLNFRNSTNGFNSTGDVIANPITVDFDSYNTLFKINKMIQPRVAFTANSVFNNDKFFQYDFNATVNSRGTSAYRDIYYYGGLAKFDVYHWSATTVNNSTAPSSTPSRPTIQYMTAASAGGYIGWVYMVGVGWKRFGQIEA